MAESEYSRRRAELSFKNNNNVSAQHNAGGATKNIMSSSFDADDEEMDEVQYRVKPSTATSQPIPLSHRCPPAGEDILAHFDEFGTTPPRTRIKNKTRDWDRRSKVTETNMMKPTKNGDGNNPSATGVSSRTIRSRVNRRNTMDCAILNEMFVDDDSGKHGDKRSKQLLRDSERDAKRASLAAIGPTGGIGGLGSNVVEATNGQLLLDERAESFPVGGPNGNFTLNQLIKCNNKYKSVSSRPVGCRTSAPAYAFQSAMAMSALTTIEPDVESPSVCVHDRIKIQIRRDFHETFANLIKLGSDKVDNKASSEIDTWQTELKDMIWLELQAWQAERTLEEQDHFLCASRKDIPQLLDKILHYRFKPSYSREVSVTSNDSGISSASESKDVCDMMGSLNFDNPKSMQSQCSSDHAYNGSTPTTPNIDKEQPCKNCFSLYCKNCQMQQGTALREVEELLTRLEDAEMLYPSSQVMGSYHPIYKSEEFVGRVKAMCLWYNITKYQRMKMTLIGILFKKMHGKSFQWPQSDFTYDHSSGSASSSTQDNDDSGMESIDSRRLPRTIPKVKFTYDGDDTATSPSPPDSASSNDSSKEPPIFPDSTDHIQESSFARFINDVQQFKFDRKSVIDPLEPVVSPYRKYIEHIMKTRGLGKSMSFLHRMHNVIIRKVQLTLEKCDADDDCEFDADIFEDDISVNRTTIDQEQEEELRRYGIWSKEARSLGLPSYAPTFVFLSVIPLEIMHEYLRLRLETRPLTPNPLSLEQLMKEVREGLILGMTHRERFHKHIHTACESAPESLEKYNKILGEYDATVREVFNLYLSYVEQWVLEATCVEQQKNAVAKEWSFAKLMAPMIHGQHSVAADRFCHIISRLLQNISQRLQDRVRKLNEKFTTQPLGGNYDKDKAIVLMICREIQAMFIIERDNSMGLLNFAKILCRDLELKDFHRDHELDRDEETSGGDEHVSVVCIKVKSAVTQLQREVLNVRHSLTNIIEHIQEKCQMVLQDEGEEQDRLVMQTRTREILNQSFKFGFDYHKELVRLFETKIVSCKDKSCEFNLSLGIIQFAKMWMRFVTTTCEKGRGVRPRWAATGLDFLISACDPVNTKHLNDLEFNDLKAEMDACISHVVGIVSEPEKPVRKRTSPRSRKVSPTSRALTPTRHNLSPRIIGDEQKLYYSQLSVKEELSGSSAPNSPLMVRKQMSAIETDSSTLKVPKINNHSLALRRIRIRDSVNQLDLQLDQSWRSRNLIGQVKALNTCDKIQIRSRSVNFRWHRGNKIGQGRFGKVYTAVNNSTGELMAMKEITIQPNETRAIKNVAEELKIFEGISHKYLVKYFGVEVHREELLIFMELCAEGTLESLIEVSGALHEGLTRRFTAQLLTAVNVLHKHGVVHRDIKTANIFLTNGGNCLKLGDFGSAVKIQAHTTVPGELKGYVGTQAYMAPEVFTKTNSDGHGRAADIWSSGCVTIEMASGKRPWAQFDSNFQIMFKVGMGETPEAPAALSTEGHDYLEHCLEHDPLKRWTARRLLDHNFCKVDMESDGQSLSTESRRNQRKTSLHRK